MPIHVTTRNKRDIVTFLSDVDVDFVSLVDHGANWTPFTSIKHDAAGAYLMPGQIIQAIIMPLEADIFELERLYGEEWFSRVNTDKRETYADKVRYVQRDESDFEEFERDAAFILKDIGDTGGHFVVGALKAGKRDEPVLKLPAGPIGQSQGYVVEANRNPHDDKGDNCMTVDEIKSLVAEYGAVAEARMMEKVEKRFADLDRGPENDEEHKSADRRKSFSTNTNDTVDKSDFHGSPEGIIRQLETLSAQVKQVAEKQEALEHAAIGRRSVPEDSARLGGYASPFKGMFAGL